MTTIEQKPQAQSTTTPSTYAQQSGDGSQGRQSEQQGGENRNKPERSQSAQQDDSFTVSADDFMML